MQQPSFCYFVRLCIFHAGEARPYCSNYHTSQVKLPLLMKYNLFILLWQQLATNPSVYDSFSQPSIWANLYGETHFKDGYIKAVQYNRIHLSLQISHLRTIAHHSHNICYFVYWISASGTLQLDLISNYHESALHTIFNITL
jgi:hypothetical protein